MALIQFAACFCQLLSGWKWLHWWAGAWRSATRPLPEEQEGERGLWGRIHQWFEKLGCWVYIQLPELHPCQINFIYFSNLNQVGRQYNTVEFQSSANHSFQDINQCKKKKMCFSFQMTQKKSYITVKNLTFAKRERRQLVGTNWYWYQYRVSVQILELSTNLICADAATPIPVVFVCKKEFSNETCDHHPCSQKTCS